MSVSVERYAPHLAETWASVLADSRNGVFLFERGYLEYHAERFTDVSAIAYLDGQPAALLPASIERASGHVSSHAGLTFGGVVLIRALRAGDSIALTNALFDALKDWGGKTLTVKLVPQLFWTYPSADFEYALWRRGFELVRRDLSSVLPLQNALPFNKMKLRSIRKARTARLNIAAASIQEFYDLLASVLQSQHGVAPVHSVRELELLSARFPERLLLRAAWEGDELLAGTLIFNYDHIWHTQYLASSPKGRECGALDLLIENVIEEARGKGATHLSFGSSTVVAGKSLNDGLLWQKESYGARAISHDHFAGPL